MLKQQHMGMIKKGTNTENSSQVQSDHSRQCGDHIPTTGISNGFPGPALGVFWLQNRPYQTVSSSSAAVEASLSPYSGEGFPPSCIRRQTTPQHQFWVACNCNCSAAGISRKAGLQNHAISLQARSPALTYGAPQLKGDSWDRLVLSYPVLLVLH